ncbi:OadG family protein [Tissierella pigra]|uniref:Uncharacterized protein n=1 Tax=Tissierella pigra TaxID=2607614 RepID=A0A6N7XTC9_9FIRM|nr:OadG family protein [Tissierella pigra]MSU01027.1 hypothetical protein [Tissierella pigra]
MGEYVSFGESIVITIFSMVVVFVGLIVLAMLISVLKAVGNKADKTENLSKIDDNVEKNIVKESKKDNVDDEALVAVIAAAVAASLGVNVPEVNIKSIKRVQQKNLVWSTTSRQEQIYGKL